MGAFFVNFHVRTDDGEQVRQAASASGASQFRVAPPRRGWVSVYEQRASSQDEEAIVRLASALSARLNTACIAFLVHDSDIACYWILDQGELRDKYNSCPDYFDAPITDTDRQRAEAENELVRGRPEVFLRYCQPTVTAAQVEAALRSEVVFAEDIVQQLAGFLGIDPERSLQDFKDGGDIDGDDDDDPGSDEPPTTISPASREGFMKAMQQQLASAFGTGLDQATTAQSDALVEAAAAGNNAEIDRLVAAGADVNARGLLPFEPFAGTTLAARAGMTPKLSISPLLAAASRGQASAVQQLIRLGANVNEMHPLYGSALHVAAQSGSEATVQLLLDAGIPAKLKSPQGHTPRDLISAIRKQIEMLKMLAPTMPQMQQVYKPLLARLEGAPEAGWNACDEALRKAGG